MKVLSLLSTVLASATASRVAMETDVSLGSAPTIPTSIAGWTRAGPATGTVKLVFAVKLQNTLELEERLLRISDPKHAEYGQQLTRDEANALVAPTQESVAAVTDFLGEYAAHVVEPCTTTATGDFVTCPAVPVPVAEKILNCTYHSYTHAAAGWNPIVRADSATGYSLPASVAAHVDFVSPTLRFPYARTGPAKMGVLAPLRQNTPATLRELYKVGKTEGNSPKNKQSCTAFLDQFYKPTDLTKFWTRYYPKAVGRTIKLVGPDSGNAGVEASLDIEYISTMGGGVETEFWSFAGRAPGNPQNEPFLDFVYLIGNTSDADVPKVFSTSYGEPEDTVGMSYMQRIEVEFMKMGARGITLLFASGDSGVAPDGGVCKKGKFAGQWPAGSPWVTGVGGSEGGSTTSPESAWSGSAGGFSDRWARPAFQTDAVAAYLKEAASTLPAATHWNQTGTRGFPDVAAQATNFIVINGGFAEPVAGTSCASPTFTGILSLLNDVRLSAGKATLGFVNPFFYQNAAAFNDVTTGANSAGIGCGGKGFSAAKGWDPVTGLGTPNYELLAAAVAALK